MAVQYEASVPRPPTSKPSRNMGRPSRPAGSAILRLGRRTRRRSCSCTGSAARRACSTRNSTISAQPAGRSPGTCRGYGNSTPLPLVSINGLAAALAAFIEELGLDRPVLVGHSLGGMLIQRLLTSIAAYRSRRGPGADQRRLRQPRPGLAGGVPVGAARTAGRRRTAWRRWRRRLGGRHDWTQTPIPAGIALAQRLPGPHAGQHLSGQRAWRCRGFDCRAALGSRSPCPPWYYPARWTTRRPRPGWQRMAARIPRCAVCRAGGRRASRLP